MNLMINLLKDKTVFLRHPLRFDSQGIYALLKTLGDNNCHLSSEQNPNKYD